MTETFRIIRQNSNGHRVIEHEDLEESVAAEFVKVREAQIGAHHQSVWKQVMSEPAPYERVPVPKPF